MVCVSELCVSLHVVNELHRLSPERLRAVRRVLGAGRQPHAQQRQGLQRHGWAPGVSGLVGGRVVAHGAAALTVHQYASLTMLITLLALASASQAASRSHPKVEQVDTEDVPPRVQRTSTLPRNQAECSNSAALPGKEALSAAINRRSNA